MSSTAKSTTKGSRSAAPKSLIVRLHLAPKLLNKWLSNGDIAKKEDSQPPIASLPAAPSTPSIKEDISTPMPADSLPDADASDNKAQPSVVPTPTEDAPTPVAVPEKKRKGPAPGSKRSAAALDANGMPKPRSKPGPKKRMKIGDDSGAPWTVPMPLTSKAGPRANQGAINAALRALDRSGKPCRKWEKKGFALRSFTGANWDMPSWRSHKQAMNGTYEGDVKSDNSGSGSGRESERSQNGADTMQYAMTPVEIASSPAPPFDMMMQT